MLKKSEVLTILENGGHITICEIYRSANVYAADGAHVDTCRIDTAEKIGRLEGFQNIRVGTGWKFTRKISKAAQEAQEEAPAAQEEAATQEETEPAQEEAQEAKSRVYNLITEEVLEGSPRALYYALHHRARYERRDGEAVPVWKAEDPAARRVLEAVAAATNTEIIINPERRYYSNWHYNAALILEALEKIVIDNGGALVSTWEYSSKQPRKRYVFTNRALSEAVWKERAFVEKLEALNRPALPERRAILERLESIDNTPRVSFYGDWLYINFALDGVYYSYDFDQNPFFPFHYSKTTIENGAIDRNHWSMEDKKEWLYDCFFKFDCSQADRIEAANMIFNMLLNARFSGKVKPARIAKLNALEGK